MIRLTDASRKTATRARSPARLSQPGMLVAASCFSFAAQAQDATPELERVVVSSSRLPVTETTASQHVSLYTREEMERAGPGNVADFLQRRAGVASDRGFGSGRFGSLYLRGADPSHVVVLIDGVRQNDPLSSRGSAVDLNTLTLDDVERIEVVRGGSAVANPEALAGVIHIITRAASTAQGQRSARAYLEAGTRGLAAAAVSFAGGGLNLGVSQREDSNSEGGAFSRTRSANAGLRGTFGATRLSFDLRYSDSSNAGFPDDSGGPLYAASALLERRTSDALQMSGLLSHRLSSQSTLDFRLVHFSRNNQDLAPAVQPGLRDPFGLPATNSTGDYRRNEAQLDWRWQAAGGWEGVVGLGTQEEDGSIASTLFLGGPVPSDFSLRRVTHNVMTEVRRNFGPWTVQAGWRHQQTPGAETLDHPAISTQYRLGTGLGQIGGALSSASKLPSFFALGNPLVGNPALKPEKSRQAELYWASDERSAWKLRVTGFYAQYRDLVDFDNGPPPRLINRQRIRSTGLEWSVRRDWARSRAWMEGTIMDVRDPNGGPPLRLRPQKQVAIGAEQMLAARTWMQVSLNYVGRRFDSSIPTGDRYLGGFTELGLGLTWRQRRWTAFARLDNAFDRRSEEIIGTPLPQRRVRVGLSWAL